VTLAVTVNQVFAVGFFRRCTDDGVSGASTGVDRNSMGHTLGERSWKNADCLCVSCIKRGRYGKVL
jgi:hypothetical protein